MLQHRETDRILNFEMLFVCARHYLDGTNPGDAYASPAFGNLRDFPPIMVHAGSRELLRDDAARLGELAGVAKFFHFGQLARIGAESGIGEQSFEQGIGMHSQARLTFELPEPFSQLAATIGIDNGARPAVPEKMTSSILPPRSDLAPCSPMTQAKASTTLDLPDPLGPMTPKISPGITSKDTPPTAWSSPRKRVDSSAVWSH